MSELDHLPRLRHVLVSALALCAPLVHAFPVIDVMAIPAAQISANATTASGAKITTTAKANSEKEQASAKSNSEKEQATATTNSGKEIAQAIKNTKEIMDQALFFAKQPVEWAKMVRDYATIAEDWPEPAESTSDASEKALSASDIKAAIQEALTAYGAATKADGSEEISANRVYEGVLQVRRDEMNDRSALIGQFNQLNRERAARMKRIERMLDMAEYQRDFDMVTTLLAMEQVRFASEQSTFELSRSTLAENAAVKRELETARRQASFTDMRLPTAGDKSSIYRPIPRVLSR